MQDPPAVEHRSEAGCLTRLYWMFFGNALWAVALAYIVRSRPGFPSLLDAAFLLALLSVVAARYVDIRNLRGLTAEGGADATMADWRKFSLVVTVVGGGAWAVIRFVTPLLSK